MDYSSSPIKICNEAGRWFVVISQVEGGYLVRDTVTRDLVYMKASDIAGCEDTEKTQ